MAITVSILYSGLAVMSAQAEEITYTDASQLAYETISRSPNSLFSNTSYSDNTVNVNSGTIGSVFGGVTQDNDSLRNTVSISSNSQVGTVFGGYSKTSSANNNVVIMENSIAENVYGATTDSAGTANNNKVNLSNITVGTRVTGGNSNGSGSASDNVVNITSSQVGSVAYGGLSQTGHVNNNSLTISDSSVGTTDKSQYLAAGYVVGYSNSVAVNNSLSILNNSKVSASAISGGMGQIGTTADNSVVIRDSEVSADLAIYGAYGFAGSANNNSVTISDSTITSSAVFGGFGIGGSAKGNTITIEGDVVFARSGGTDIVGGVGTGASADSFTNNTLNWAGKASNVKAVANFEYYNFTIPENAVAGDTLLDMNGRDKAYLQGSKIKIVASNALHDWKKGETLSLIHSPGGFDTDGDTQLIDGKIAQGAKLYKYELSIENTDLLASISPDGIGEHAKSLSEGRVAALGFINTAADMVAGDALSSAVSTGNSNSSFGMFSGASYGTSRLNSGSHVDVKGTALLLGMSRKLKLQNSELTFGAFLEGGWSSYDTYNNFADVGDVRGNGKANYFGMGLLASNQLKNDIYVEGSVRIGRISTDYNSTDINSKYDTKSTYYGAHIGLGKILKLNDRVSLDVYSKYFWSHQNASSAIVAGDNMNFDAQDSHRLRLGARIKQASNKSANAYFGLAYEYEFAAQANATVGSDGVAAPSMRGGTAIGELGLIYKPQNSSAFNIDVGSSAYTGKRQGVSGNVKFNWVF